MKQWILENLSLILSTAFGRTSFLAYVLERKKRKIEEKQLTADALSKMQEGYDKFTSDLLSRYDELKQEVTDLKKNLAEVESQLDEEKGKYKTLKSNYDKLKTSYDTLKREFDNYKKSK